MKTNAKKRMLISSVAMLLVAMIALGTATFAWFTTSTNPYADGFSATTTKQSTLLLANNTRTGWSTHLDYKVSSKTMYPASGNGLAWVKGTSNNSLTGAIDNTTLANVLPTPDPNVSVADYVFANELNIKNNGTADVTNIKIKFFMNASNNDDSASYARVALVPVDGTKVTPNALAEIKTGNVYATNNRPYKPIIDTAGKLGDAEITPSTTFTVNVTTGTEVLKPNVVKYYKLFVWFEGQDIDCTDALSGQAIPNLKFEITSELVEE